MSDDKRPETDRYQRGFPLAAMRTPYIEVDDLILQRNLIRVQDKAREANVLLRPHVKTHKSLLVGRRQMQLGAVGLTASKPSEAMVFVDAGFTDITLAYPVIDPASVEELAALAAARKARVGYIASSREGVEALDAVGTRFGVRLDCSLKIDVGLHRVGVRSDDPLALDLAADIASRRGLRFAGLLSHAGQAYSSTSSDELRRIALEEAELLTGLRDKLIQAGLPAVFISTGSTPTVLGAPIAPGSDEIRPGNYAFLDLTAVRLGLCGPEDLALTVVARVVATNERHVIVDAGSKTLSSDFGPHGTGGGGGFGLAVSSHVAASRELYRVERLSEEHGFVAWSKECPPIGSLMRIYPNHSCAVMAQFDSFVLTSEGAEPQVAPVDARGRLT